MRVAIIDYGSGNLRSATKAFERSVREAAVDAHVELTDRRRSSLPPIVSFFQRWRLCRLPPRPCSGAGMEDALLDVVEAKGRPFLGICVGMQLMSSRGLEKEVTQGLG